MSSGTGTFCFPSNLAVTHPDAPRPYRMWGYPWTLWVFVAVSVWFMVNALVTQPGPSLMAFVIVGSGIAAYWVWRKLKL